MSKLDLIIPTHNRTEYLKRVLDYYQKYGRDFNCIVADSSNQIIKRRNKKLIKNYTKLNLLYIDNFSDKLIQSHKFAKMVQYARSKYVCLCADDDFIVPNAIQECVNFLEKHPDYSTAHGSYIGFHLFRYPLISPKFGWTFRYSPHTISFQKPIDRLNYYLSNHSQVLWAVRRTDIVKTCYKKFLETHLDPYLIAMLGEMVPDALTIISGKVKRLNIFYGARQYFGSIINYFPSFFDAKKTGRYNSEYKKFKSCLINRLETIDHISKEKVSQVIDLSFANSNNLSYQQHLMSRANFFLKNYPRFFYQTLRTIQALYLFSKKKTDPIGKIDNPTSQYFVDFNNIRESVIEHSMILE